MIPFGSLPRWVTTTSGQSVSQVRCARIICEDKPEVEITQLWDLEQIGIVHDEFSPSEQETVSVVRSNIKYSESGYIVRLPFKDDTRPSVYYRTARGQLNRLIHRTTSDEQFGKQYDDVVKTYTEM